MHPKTDTYQKLAWNPKKEKFQYRTEFCSTCLRFPSFPKTLSVPRFRQSASLTRSLGFDLKLTKVVAMSYCSMLLCGLYNPFLPLAVNHSATLTLCSANGVSLTNMRSRRYITFMCPVTFTHSSHCYLVIWDICVPMRTKGLITL